MLSQQQYLDDLIDDRRQESSVTIPQRVLASDAGRGDQQRACVLLDEELAGNQRCVQHEIA